MTDDLLRYYSRELAYLRKMGAKFAEAHPKIAGRLRMSGEMVEDPHVSRMIEAFAYLNARTRRKIEDEFPEITEAFLNVLYPHYLAPFPSAAICRFQLDRSQVGLTAGITIPRGTSVETAPTNYGEPCRFRTCYPVNVWPLELSDAVFEGQPFTAPLTCFTQDAAAVLRLQLTPYADEVQFADYQIDRLRLYLNGSEQVAYQLYELLNNNLLGIAVAGSHDDPQPELLTSDHLHPVGFGRDEGLIDYSARSFLGYRLLTEFFVFPQKFLFVDIAGLSARVLATAGNWSRRELYLFFNRQAPDLEHQVSRESLLLGCTPMLNLYRQRAEPIQLTHQQNEYRIVPDARRPLAHEVFSVEGVVATSPTNETLEYAPFYSLQHHQEDGDEGRFWYARRHPAAASVDDMDRGTEVQLSLVDLDLDPSLATDWTLDVETTCLNRDLPGRLPFGGGQPRLQAETGELTSVTCVTAPTKTYRPVLHQGTLWRLISHLTLNHLSLVDGEGGADALREILKLYDPVDSEGTQAMIDGLRSVKARRVVARVGGPVSAGFCRGLEVTLSLDETKFAGTSLFLFAAVLDRFLGLYSSVNSFTKTVIVTSQRGQILCRWPARAGEKVLL